MATRKQDPAKKAHKPKARSKSKKGPGKKVSTVLVQKPRALGATEDQAYRAVEALAGPASATMHNHPRRPSLTEAQTLVHLAKQHTASAGASAFVLPALEHGRVLAYGTPAQIRALLKPAGLRERFRSAVTGLFVRKGDAQQNPTTTVRESR